MSIAVKKAMTNRFLAILTFALVFINLVPIGWMVYCSFKDNEEILAGEVAPGRRHNDVAFMEPTPTGFLVGTQDGGVNQLDAGLKLLKHSNLGTFATSYLLEKDTLWVLSSNRGLQAVSTHDLAVLASYPIEEIAKAYGEAWKTLWVNDVAGSSLERMPDGIYLSFLFRDIPGIMRFDPAGRTFLPVAGLTTDKIGLVRHFARQGGDTLSLLTSKGYFRYASLSQTMVKAMPSPAVIPGDIGGFAELDKNRVVFTRGKGALIYDLDGDTTLAVLDAESGLGTSVISAMTVQTPSMNHDSTTPTCLWLGNSQMVASIPLTDGAVDYRVMEKRLPAFPLLGEAVRNPDDVTGNETTNLLALEDGSLLAGGVRGGLALLGASGGQTASLRLPKPPFYFRWRNFLDLWRYIDFGLYLYNSFVVCGSVMIIAMVLASLGGYALARYEFPGRSSFGYSVLATQMIPGIMLLLPIYLMYVNIAKSTGLVIKGTYFGLIITYAAYFVPFSIWILRGFFASIPKELEEAALIDGCGPFRAFFRIIVPSAMPGIVATGVYVFLSAWDELMFAWVLTSEKTYTIPVGIRLFVGNFQNRYDLMMAAATVSTLPVMILFFLMQKQIVSGLTAGAVKD